MTAKETPIRKLESAARNATASGREMAEELSGRVGVKRIIEIWERHQADVRTYVTALGEAHTAYGSTLNSETEGRG